METIWYHSIYGVKMSVSLLGEFSEDNYILQFLPEEVNKKERNRYCFGKRSFCNYQKENE